MEAISTVGSIFTEFLAQFELLAIFVVMLPKEFGLPIPVPSDLIMLTVGVQFGLGEFNVLELLAAIWITMLVGGSGQFFVASSAGRELVYWLNRMVGPGDWLQRESHLRQCYRSIHETLSGHGVVVT